ncbi:MAG TPA: hypothetical protein VFL29_12485 [Candidatus Dormibacteraeota bacterium]|nr:hypothetical protein [Candidatus Dormibacteraeota bacterium]
MAFLVPIGILIVLAGIAVELKREAVIRRVTSQSLGSLAPGYAATRLGLTVYATLIDAIGLATVGVGLTAWTIYGAVLAGFMVALFLVLSVFAIVGEVRTYRSLKR